MLDVEQWAKLGDALEGDDAARALGHDPHLRGVPPRPRGGAEPARGARAGDSPTLAFGPRIPTLLDEVHSFHGSPVPSVRRCNSESLSRSRQSDPLDPLIRTSSNSDETAVADEARTKPAVAHLPGRCRDAARRSRRPHPLPTQLLRLPCGPTSTSSSSPTWHSSTREGRRGSSATTW